MVSWLSCGEAIAIFNNNAKNRKVKIKKKKKAIVWVLFNSED